MTVGFIVVATGWLIYIFTLNGGVVAWETAITLLPVTIVLLFGAAYAAQQSTRHRNVEVRNRRFALEMQAIDPYLQSLNAEDQQKLKIELTKRFFGQGEETDGTTVLDEHAAKRLLETIGQQFIKPVADITKFFK